MDATEQEYPGPPALRFGWQQQSNYIPIIDSFFFMIKIFPENIWERQ
jgi:hypothetical protein